jgi:hypothetical protein
MVVGQTAYVFPALAGKNYLGLLPSFRAPFPFKFSLYENYHENSYIQTGFPGGIPFAQLFWPELPIDRFGRTLETKSIKACKLHQQSRLIGGMAILMERVCQRRQNLINHFRNIMSLANPILLLRNLLAFLFYLPIRYIMPITLIVIGWKRSAIGKCIIVVPTNKTVAIVEGIAYLKGIDPEMHRLLTTEHKYLIWYHPKQFLQIRDIVTINDNFLLWGKEGVAILLVQCVLDFTIDYPAWKKTLSRKVRRRTRNEIQRQLFEWMSKHSFSSELLKQYREFAIDR